MCKKHSHAYRLVQVFFLRNLSVPYNADILSSDVAPDSRFLIDLLGGEGAAAAGDSLRLLRSD